MFLVSTNIVAL